MSTRSGRGPVSSISRSERTSNPDQVGQHRRHAGVPADDDPKLEHNNQAAQSLGRAIDAGQVLSEAKNEPTTHRPGWIVVTARAHLLAMLRKVCLGGFRLGLTRFPSLWRRRPDQPLGNLHRRTPSATA